MRWRKLGLKLGYTIGCDVFDYGLILPHYGTIVIGANNTIGRYACLQICTNIEGNKISIGDYFYLGTGAKVVRHITIADNVIVGANCVVNKDIDQSNVMVAGIPGNIKKEGKNNWTIGSIYEERVRKIEELYSQTFKS